MALNTHTFANCEGISVPGPPLRRLLAQKLRLESLLLLVPDHWESPLEGLKRRCRRLVRLWRLRRDRRLLTKSQLFDTAWYLTSYPDVQVADVDPIAHYLVHGTAEGRNPGPDFDARHYLSHNPDVAEGGTNPLVHYLRHGRSEGRSSRPVGSFSIFDARPELAPLPLHYSRMGARRVTIVTDTTSSSFLFGGVITAIIVGALLAERLDAQLRLITRSHAPDLTGFADMLRSSGLGVAPDVSSFWLPPGSALSSIDMNATDIFLTTSWWTTRSTLGSVPGHQIVYLVQDDERIFYAHGDQLVRCQEVFDDPTITFLVNTELLFEHFETTGGSNIVRSGTWFEPAFPELLFHPAPAHEGKRLFVFYARPSNPRNLYLRGLETIAEALREDILSPDQWDFVFIGSPGGQILLPRGVRPILKPALPLLEYASLLGGTDLGLALMHSPHPSYPPLDLAASGAVAVTSAYRSKSDLSKYSANILVGGAGVTELAALVCDGASLASDSSRRRANYVASQLSRDWRRTTLSMIDWLSGRVG